MRTTIGITAGDPAGIGLEVILKAIPSVLDSARWVLFTDENTFQHHYSQFDCKVPYRWITGPNEVSDDRLLFLRSVPVENGTIPWGAECREAGARAILYLEAASDAALDGQIQGIVTAPVSKISIEPHFKGQTELLAERAATAEFAMAFFAPTFKVVLATMHLALKDALDQISPAGYIQLIQFLDREFQRLGFKTPRIAVAAINPHAGEGGMFGLEDLELLKPAVDHCARLGISVTGPHSADSLYYRAHSGEFDIVVAPYHDQALIPVKLIAHGNSVNVTLGLPFVRTSPDHGTAFAIAGQGVADPSGMGAAMRCAVDLVGRQSKN